MSNDCKRSRNAGMLPSGPLRATNASRNSINFFSSGTCDATASGAKSAKDLKLSSTGSSAFSSSVSLFFTVAVIFSSLSRITASKLFLSTVTVARSSNGVCSACPLKSPTTRVYFDILMKNGLIMQTYH
ncbi:Uncharacterised protein [Vibrio cholerae]|nr:Uncharacterised protein [Vibrio cholerae]